MSENQLWLLWDTWSAIKQGPSAIAQRQRARFTEMVAFARASSPYYRELYRDLPERVEDPMVLPVTSKKALMARFNDWGTDRDVTVEPVQAFVNNLEVVGERFLGKYTVATTSGTTGTRGIFLLDSRSMAVTNTLLLRMMSAWLSIGDIVGMVQGGGRTAMVMATGGHFASAVAAARLRKGHRWHRKIIGVFPVQTPLPELVARLNRFRPAIVAPYASMAALLASEQEAGRLRINPALMVLSAEGLPEGEYDRIARAFGTKVRDSYAATECPFLSYRCEHGWLHVNSDWVLLEPVDAEYHPVEPGDPSHTVLVSNLANRVQPILRYDLGDSILQRPDPCPCGNPLPAIRVQGRAADVLTFPTERGEQVTIAPLAFGTLVDRIPGIELIQIVQSAPTVLRVRLRPAASADPERVWQAVEAEFNRLLAGNGLGQVEVERAEEPPEQGPGGKYREVIPLS
jgi:phenylacetate-coenzyme A ligase PaaK-like adenylate-forming protein